MRETERDRQRGRQTETERAKNNYKEFSEKEKIKKKMVEMIL